MLKIPHDHNRFGIARRCILAALELTEHELSENLSREQRGTAAELLRIIRDYRSHCHDDINLANAALDRVSSALRLNRGRR